MHINYQSELPHMFAQHIAQHIANDTLQTFALLPSKLQKAEIVEMTISQITHQVNTIVIA